MNYTKKQIKEAFKKWETELRLDPKSFHSAKHDRLGCSVNESAVECTKTLLKYMES